MPDVGPIEAALGFDGRCRERSQLSAWKVYTHSPNGWFLDDHDPALPQVGAPFIKPSVTRVWALSPCTRVSPETLYVVDIGPAAAANPMSASSSTTQATAQGTTEGPYDPEGNGVDRLVRSVTGAGIGSGANVYAELGSTWRIVMGDPDAAAHVLGKLLTAFGPGASCGERTRSGTGRRRTRSPGSARSRSRRRSRSSSAIRR